MHRAHNAQEALASIRNAQKYFENISIDLIYGIPEMPLDRWKKIWNGPFSWKCHTCPVMPLQWSPKQPWKASSKKDWFPQWMRRCLKPITNFCWTKLHTGVW